jgi:dolichol-phosphate mannosyltransferase
VSGARITIAPDGPLIIPPSDDALALSVVVPTFKESENIALFLEALCDSLDPVLPGAYEIIVMDDDSPDGTLDAAAAFAASRPQIRLVKRVNKRELATAVIRGWQLARGQVLSTINADFQHPPALIAGLWQLLQTNDLVVASRYCKGGGVGNWSITRRILSRGATLMGQIILPQVYNRVTDPLSGCYMFRRKTIANVELNPLGYKSLIEIMVRGRVRTITELPYHMRERERGKSKATGARSLDYIKQLIRLRKAWNKASLGDYTRSVPRPNLR